MPIGVVPTSIQSVNPLMNGARRIVGLCAGVRTGERVVIVTDTNRPPQIATALSNAVVEAGGVPVICSMQPVPSGAEPPAAVRAAMTQADVIFAPTSGALYHTAAVRDVTSAGARFLGLTDFTLDVLLSGGVFADFPALAPRAYKLAAMLDAASVARVTAPGGTNFTVRLDDRKAVPITGMARNPGERTGCPDIESFIAPLEESAEGVVIVDASASLIGVLDEPIRIELKGGQAVSIQGGGSATAIAHALEAAGTLAAYTFAELAFGLNTSAIIRGVIVEDEGVAGTGHIALGSNIHFGGISDAPLHLDFVYRQPTVWLDGVVIMQDGEPVGEGWD